MIFGIGTDVVEVARMDASITKFGLAFAERILSVEELESFSHSNQKAQFLAKRFAAKEAFSKALGTGLRAPATFQNISITHDALGKPLFKFAPDLLQFLRIKGIHHQHLTVSDERALAVAFVVLET